MAFTYPTVNLGDDYTVYANQETADAYLEAAQHAATWRASTTTDDDKARALVTATRLLDRQRWKGDKTDSSQAHAWPRSNTGVTGVVDNQIPEAVTNACIELALALLDGSDVQSEQTTEQKLQSIRAGSVSLTYFRGAEGPPRRFPLIVHELLRDYLAGAGVDTLGMKVTGASAESRTGQDFGIVRGL